MNLPAGNDPELDALLGAYALDALDGAERAQVAAYIAANARARDEVDELLESAASLALAPVDDTTAPPELWERISRTIERELASEEDDENEVNDELAAQRARRRSRWMTIVAVAAAVIAVLLTAQVVSLHNSLNTARSTGETDAAAAFARAADVHGARKLALAPAHGPEVARVVLLPDGSGYLKNDHLAQLDAAHTYQLWELTGSAAHPIAISAGVLGPHPKAAAFRTASDVRGFALTIEPAPGVAQPSQAPFASASVS